MVLAAYNAGFADSNGLMRLNPNTVKGIKLKVNAGVGSFEKLPNWEKKKAKIVGITSYGSSLAAIVPKEVVYHYHEHFEKSQPASPSGLVVDLKQDANIDQFAKSIKGTGLEVSGANNLIEKIHSISQFTLFFLQVLGGILFTFSFIILVILYQYQLLARLDQFKTLVSLGVQKSKIILTLALEALVSISLIGIIAFFIGRGIASYLFDNITKYVFNNFGFEIATKDFVFHEQSLLMTLSMIIITTLISTIRAQLIIKNNID